LKENQLRFVKVENKKNNSSNASEEKKIIIALEHTLL
jgi:hypothetical protein